MLYRTWLFGSLRRRRGEWAGTLLGIALAVALLVTLAGFFAASRSRMTEQAIADVPIDWQVQLAPGADPAAAIAELQRDPGYRQLAQVGYFDTPGFQATTGSTVQTTGAGKVLGIPPEYRAAFPAEIRLLLGDGDILLAQQTAANLHAEPGTVVSIARPGLPPAEVTVAAIIDLPRADTLFQAIGVPAGSAPQAPPDNVLLLPLDQWHALFDPVAGTAPDAVRTQLHVQLPHRLPADPTAAYTQALSTSRNYESRLAGAGVVGDNLAARLDVARSDALYAEVLFLFLGLPGAILAGLLTAVLVAAGAGRRRRDQALLRLRGARATDVLRLAALEAVMLGLLGSGLGLALGSLAMRLTFGHWSLGNWTTVGAVWVGGAAAGGLALALLCIVIPTWRDARRHSFVLARRVVRRDTAPWWERAGLDGLLLGLAALVYWHAARGGYQVVVAPEGVPRVSVSYTSFFAPLLLWIGAALLMLRLTRLLFALRGRLVAPLLRPLGHQVAGLSAAALSRQRALLATGLMLVAVAVAFAGSTAIFNATYRAQSEVDAQLTNGADVTVTGPAAADLAARQGQLAALPGVRAIEPLQHRYAYVGTDLQDLYGIRPSSIHRATTIADAYFAGGHASDLLARLAATPDGVLVAAETVRDFQLQPGDLLRLRLQSASDQQYHVVEFHYLGIVREFPTAPSDSFLVANADYVAAQTGSDTVGTLLIRTNGSPPQVADEVRATLGATSGATVQDIVTQRRITTSSLTAISLRGLTRIELGFAAALATVGAGLVLALGREERRRTLALATALGAQPRELRALVWGEALLIGLGGLLAGELLGWGLAHMLVKLLTGVFDPPPEHASVPWTYLLAVAGGTLAGVSVAGRRLSRLSRQRVLETLRQL